MTDHATDTDALPGNTKVTREDWLRVAMELLVTDGVSEVKILTIGDRLAVSRSSFYWYFKSRKDLLTQLLAEWDRTNTGIPIAHTRLPAKDIIDAVNGFFLCVVDPAGFNHRLDFAVREWARRDAAVRRVIDRSDTARTEALAGMFARHGYPPDEADIRARVLYYQQIGYYALELNETLEERLARVPAYLHAFTGVRPRPEQVAWFIDQARARAAG
jgi:AcrR family transcriptional regulator